MKITPFILLAWLASAPALAETPQESALAHNAAYDKSAATGLSPQTMFEMLTCSAMWDRWDYAVSSAADARFKGALRSQLSSANAKKRKIYWLRMARREVSEEDNPDYFQKSQARAQTSADKVYAAYAADDPKATGQFMSWLGSCK